MEFAVRATRFPSGDPEPRGDYISENHPTYGWVTHPVRSRAVTFETRDGAQDLADELNSRAACNGVEIYTVVD